MKLSNHNVIPEFDPMRREQTVDMWLHKVNECAVIYNWTEQQTTHFALPKLKGLAKKWYEGLPTVLHSWQEWQAKLKQAFPSEENYGQLLNTMLAKRARYNDSLEEYYYDKLILLNRCGIDGKRAVDCIVYGIDDRSVRLGAEAARYESPEKLLPYLKNIKGGTFIAPFDRRKVKNTDNKTEVVPKQNVRDRVVTCYNCQQVGHYKSQCPKPIIRCNRCSLSGHTAEKCPTAKNGTTSTAPKEAKSVLCINGLEPKSSKYYKQAFVNGVALDSFIDFGSTATMISVSGANSIQPGWKANGPATLPSLRGFGEAIVQPLGVLQAEVVIDSVTANVDILVVPDEVMRIPLLVGQSFTEQSHILVQKDSSSLCITSLSESTIPRVKLICHSDVEIKALTSVQVTTDPPTYTGDVYVTSGNRLQFGREFYIMQGLYSMKDGRGSIFVKGLSDQPFIIQKGALLVRSDQAQQEEAGDKVHDVLRVESLATLRPIVEEDVNTDDSLDKAVKIQLLDLLNKYRSCFAFSLKELGKTDLVEMSIPLKDDEPVVYRPYRLPFNERGKVREMVQELMDCDIVRPSSSSYASPIVMVKKKTGDVRLCVDYRALNRKTVRENYPLPRIDDQLDDLAGYNYYSTLDLASGYYQIGIKEADRHKTSFVTPDGQFEFCRMPFGLANAPSVFMRMINLVLSSGVADGPSRSKGPASAYMDDIIVPSVDLTDGLVKLEEVLQLLQFAGLTLKLSKCCFFSKSVDYLGFELSANGIKPGARKIEAVRDFPEPKDQHTVRQFIGLCSFFRRFVRNFAVIAKPLTSLLRKDCKWSWGSEQTAAFNKLKQELIQKPTLALYDPKAITELHTDACKLGVAGILMQRDDTNKLRPVAYFSRQTTKDEQHMTAYELETLAVIASLQRFRVYLIGIEFKIYTDCNSLRATFLKRDLIPRVARWWIAMQEFNFSVEYRPGKFMTYVDALSRNPPSSGGDSSGYVMEVTTSDWLSTVQDSDSEIQRKISILRDPNTNDVIDVHSNYVVRNNKLYRKTEQGERWVVPKGVRWQILKQCHDDIGHFALEKTLSKLQETYWFAKMRRFVKKYVESCLECAYAKSSSRKRPPLNPIPKDDTPFGTLHIDHVGPFVKSSKGNTHVFVIIDGYTKFIMLKPVKNTKTSVAINKLREYFSIFGIPKRIISDRGSCFTSSKFKMYLDELGVRHVLNAVATPRANGQVERYNRTLLEALTAKCAGLDEKKWDVQISDVQLGLNNTYNKGIGKTPAQALFGTSLTGMTEGRIKSYLDNENMNSNNSISEIRDEINKYVAKYQEKQKSSYDKNTSESMKFGVGDLVSLEREVHASGQSKKLVPKFQGPYRVTAVLGNDRYQVEDTPLTRKNNRRYSACFAVDKMKPWLNFNRSNIDSSSSGDEMTCD